MTPLAGHQTARLSKGRHTSPEHGTCVMELASMLAGEPFSDAPRSVCPVIAAFLRRYNDAVDEARRAALYAFAAKAVGTRGSRRVRRARARRCREWHAAATGRRWCVRLISGPEAADLAACAGAAISERHPSALLLLDELIALGRAEDAVPDALPVPCEPRSGTTWM
jgi:hypothetical protein